MKWFRSTLRENRIFVLTLISVSLFGMMDMRNYVYAYQEWEAKEKRLQEISEFLDVPVDQLRPDHETVYDRVKDLFGIEEEDPIKAAGMKRLQEVLRKHEEQLAANPYLPQIEKVKREHAPSRIEGLLRDVLQLTEPRHGKSLSEGSQRALLRGLHYGMKDGLEKSLELPVDDDLPAKARRKHAQFQAKLNQVMGNVKRVVDETQSEDMAGTLPQKVSQLRLKEADGLSRKIRKPRYLDRGLPNQRVEKKAQKRATSEKELSFTPQPVQASQPLKSLNKNGIHQEILDLAESLDHTPSKIFSWVHDTIEVDPKWGATKSPVGTLREKLGTSWDQAWLLQELLIASGVDARLEWGEVQIELDQLRDLTGVENAWRAGDMMTTAGTPFVLLTQGDQPVAARMDHVWVKAHLDYVPRRAALPHGTGDTWVRMDPTIKQYNETEGIQLYDKVPFTLESYLLSGTTESPRRVYEDAMWQYIRDNNIECATLEQVKRARSIQQESFPFVPGSLRAKVISVDGESATTPDTFQYQIAFDVRDLSGRSLLQWQAPWPSVYGKRLELAWPGATADDQAVLDAEGGVFETPPYLVDLKPSLRLDGLTAQDGQPIGSAEDVEIYGTLTPPASQATNVLFQGQAGERNVFAIDLGTTPQQRLDELQTALNAATESSNDAETEANTLALIGAAYVHQTSRSSIELADYRWSRYLNLGIFGTSLQSLESDSQIGDVPINVEIGPLVVDIGSQTGGLFSGAVQGGRQSSELVAAHASFLEGAVLNQTTGLRAASTLSMFASAIQAEQVPMKLGPNDFADLEALDLPPGDKANIAHALSLGGIAWVHPQKVTIEDWEGSGYVLQAGDTGGFYVTGGYAGGISAEKGFEVFVGALGNEIWLSDPLVLEFFRQLGIDLPTVPSTQQSDPVNMSNGNFWFNTLDLGISNVGIPIVWERTYNSQAKHDLGLGVGWSWSLGLRVQQRDDQDLEFWEGDGTIHLFRWDEGTQSFQHPPGKNMELTVDQEGYTLSDLASVQLRFDSTGRLLSQSDRFGNYVTLTYSPEGQLSRVVDSDGLEVLSVTYDGDHIGSVKDFSGREVAYFYTGNQLTGMTDANQEFWSFAYDASGRMLERTDPLGHRDTYQYDSLGRLVSHVDANGGVEHFLYEAADRTAVVRDQLGYETLIVTDEHGRAVSEVDPLGVESVSTWNEDNFRTSTASGGIEIQSTSDDRGLVTSMSGYPGLSRELIYEPDTSRLIQSIVGNRVLTYGYQGSSDTLETIKIEVDGETKVHQTFSTNDRGQITLVQGQDGSTRQFTWDSKSGSLASVVSGGYSRVYELDSLGRVESMEENGRKVFDVQWNALGRFQEGTDETGKTLRISYDSAGRRTGWVSPDGEMELKLDPVGRVLEQTDFMGRTTKNEYDAVGNLISRTNVWGGETRFLYDANRRLIAKVDERGGVWTSSYCGAISLACETVDPSGVVTKVEFDSFGRVKELKNRFGGQVQLAYDDIGRISQTTDAEGFTEFFEYDWQGNVAKYINRDGGESEFEFDSTGRLVKLVDAKGRSWNNQYVEEDDFTYSVLRQEPAGEIEKTWLNSLDVKTRKARGEKILQYTHQGVDLRSISDLSGGVETFKYNSAGELTGFSNGYSDRNLSFDPLGQISRTVDVADGIQVDYESYPEGLIKKVQLPSRSIEYFYDTSGLLTEISDSLMGRFQIDHDVAGRRSRIKSSAAGVEVRYSYDELGRLDGITWRDDTGRLLRGLGYEYNSRGMVSQKVTFPENQTLRYEYDPNGRLKRWEEMSSGEFQEFTYDLVGNRKVLKENGSETTYSYSESNRILGWTRVEGGEIISAEYSWDDSGDLVEKRVSQQDPVTLEWDAIGRLQTLSIGQSEEYSFGYDPYRNRVSRSTSTGTVRQLLGRNDEVLAEFNENGEATRHYLFEPNRSIPLAEWSPTEGTKFLLSDELGTVQGEKTSSGYRAYGLPLPFGERGQETPGDYFGGHKRDPSGLIYMKARYYDPEIGRFISPDPLRISQLPADSSNKFSYVTNNPVMFVDPDGYQQSIPSDEDETRLFARLYDGAFSYTVFAAPTTLLSAILTAGTGGLAWPTLVAAIASAVLGFGVVNSRIVAVDADGNPKGRSLSVWTAWAGFSVGPPLSGTTSIQRVLYSEPLGSAFRHEAFTGGSFYGSFGIGFLKSVFAPTMIAWDALRVPRVVTKPTSRSEAFADFGFDLGLTFSFVPFAWSVAY